MFAYLGTLPVGIQVVISMSVLICFIAVIASFAYAIAHRKLTIKMGDKEIDVTDEAVKTEVPVVKS